MRLPILLVCIVILAVVQLFIVSTSASEEAPITIGSDLFSVSELDPQLVHLHRLNTTLSNEISETATEVVRLHLETTVANAVVERIEADFKDARATLESVGRVNRGLGPLLRQHHESLPDDRYYTLRIEHRMHKMAELGVRRMLHREAARGLAEAETNATVPKSLATTDSTPAFRDALRELRQDRHELLNKALQQDEAHLQSLQALDNSERDIVTILHEYDEFLRQHLWWLRGAEPTSYNDIRTLFAGIERRPNFSHWMAYASSKVEQLQHSVFLWLGTIIASFIIWKRRAIIAEIQASSDNLGKIRTDRLVYTFKALIWTLIAAAPLPLLLLILSWQLTSGETPMASTTLPYASLLHLCGILYVLSVVRWTCIPGGLAEAHFRWAKQDLALLRRELRRLSWIAIPSYLCIWFVYTQHSVNAVTVLPRLSFLLFHIALALSLYRILHRKRGVLGIRFRRHSKGMLYRLYPIGFWFLVLLPPWLGVEMLGGYVHSSIAVTNMLLSSLTLGIVLIYLYALAQRWLLVVHRRLAYEAAIERRRTMLASREAKASGVEEVTSAELILEEPEVNLTELSKDTRGLVSIIILFIGLLGLYFIWMPIFPALRIFDTVNLWYRSVNIDGQVERLPTTLADMGRALLMIFATVILVSRLPSVLEIILLQRSTMSEGDRYTLLKLTTYALVALGGVFALNAIGANWSELQWLIAALGVGIGFGLQEVVANFISGLIILFERPIRIGDVVTIGDTSGIVTKIRIRATTIRDWDRKELLVPNKDLITERVLNWSLSDEMTRIVITVGVAYESDVDTALELMKAAAAEHEHALKDPAPIVSFDNFGDHALILTMRVYVSSISHRIKTVTELRMAINTKFRQAGITISYPQRDVHFDTRDPLRISIERAGAEVVT